MTVRRTVVKMLKHSDNGFPPLKTFVSLREAIRSHIKMTLFRFLLLLCLVETSGVASGGQPQTAKPLLAAGGYHSLFLDTHGVLWAWGCNKAGQLGDGTTIERDVPFKAKAPPDMPPVVALAAGEDFTLALTSNGTIWACGLNDQGQLGDGTTNSHSNFVLVQSINHATTLAAGQKHALALTVDGTVWGWGANQRVPTPIPHLSNICGIAAGGQKSLAVTKDGKVWSWENIETKPAETSSAGASVTPSLIPNLNHVRMVASGQNHNLALLNDGTVWAWGCNDHGQLGDGTQESHSAPTAIPELKSIQSIDAGYEHSAAIDTEGTIWLWGDNNFGQLGTSSGSYHVSPRRLTPTPSPKFQLIRCGGYHTLLTGETGKIFSTGHNYFGQLGDWSLQDQFKPVPVRK